MKNEIVEAKCIDMSVDGHGIAKTKDDLVIFVKEMIVGEVANVKIVSQKKNYAYGIIDKLLTSSDHRIKSDCPISYKCGGCDYRYIDYDYQLVLKKKVLENTFKDYTVLDIIKDDNPYYYRNKVQIPVANHIMGFYRKYSNDIVEFDDCLIESKTANEIIKDLKVLLIENNLDKYIRHVLIKHSKVFDEIMIGFIVNTFDCDFDIVVKTLINKYKNIQSIILNLNTTNSNVILGDEEKLLYGRNYIYDEIEGLKFRISLKSFYQVNYSQMIKLYGLIKDYSNVSKNDNVLDLYCGIGTISLYLSRYAKSVTGVEIVKEAIENAKNNAKDNNIDNVNFILADANKSMDQFIVNSNIVVLDPPRKGVSKELISNLTNSKVERIVYVSCNPATLARDLDMFKDNFKVSDIQPVDMFPFTTHVEAICCLTRK